MIELMLEAERAMGIGLLDNAERMYSKVVAVDPRNSIAWTGLARVALEREDQLGAYLYARRAIALDPQNPVASHLARRMAEQFRMRGEEAPADLAPVVESAPSDAPSTAPGDAAGDGPEAVPGATSGNAAPGSPRAPRRGIVARLLRRGP
jgi:hypothetical protein